MTQPAWMTNPLTHTPTQSQLAQPTEHCEQTEINSSCLSIVSTKSEQETHLQQPIASTNEERLSNGDNHQHHQQHYSQQHYYQQQQQQYSQYNQQNSAVPASSRLDSLLDAIDEKKKKQEVATSVNPELSSAAGTGAVHRYNSTILTVTPVS